MAQRGHRTPGEVRAFAKLGLGESKQGTRGGLDIALKGVGDRLAGSGIDLLETSERIQVVQPIAVSSWMKEPPRGDQMTDGVRTDELTRDQHLTSAVPAHTSPVGPIASASTQPTIRFGSVSASSAVAV